MGPSDIGRSAAVFKDYYLILGVPLDAETSTIRSAFRRLAKRYHPDHSGPAGAPTFRELSEAYDVLTDPARRAHFDRELRGTGRPAASAGDAEFVSWPVPLTGEPELVRPSFEALLGRFESNFGGFYRPKAERTEPLEFELILSADEARGGVRVPFQVPVFGVCEACGGSGREWGFPCSACEATGRLGELRTVEVEIPPRVRDGGLFEVSLEQFGVRNLWLRLHVRVAAH